MRAQFVLSEIGIGLRRNLTMTVAVVVTVAISLALFGVGLLIQRQVETMKDYWYDKVEVTVYLCGKESEVPSCAAGAVTGDQRAEIKTDLEALPQVKEIFYESQDEAFQRFKQRFEGSAIADNVTADALPESYRIKLKDPEQFQVVASALTGRPGVESVQDQRALLERFFRVLNTLQRIVIFIALFQVVAAALLISNTIRVAAFSRRRETGIMRLVGASNFYIQLPFLLEGAIAGLIGAVIASGLLAIGQYFIQDEIAPAFAFTRFVGWDALLGIIPILLLAGVLLSGLASFFTLRRYLKV
jgi:cell division transport system permease protein